MLKLMADACKIIIAAIQGEYNYTNIKLDSYHVIAVINKYMKYKRKHVDVMISFNFTSFHTELPINFILNKLRFACNLFSEKYQQQQTANYKLYKNLTLFISEGYEIAGKYCIIKIDGKYYI